MGKVKLIYGTIPYVYTTEPKIIYGSIPFVTTPLKLPTSSPPPPSLSGINTISGVLKVDVSQISGIDVNNITSISGISFD